MSLLYSRTDVAPPTQPNAQGQWDPLPGAQQAALKIEEQKAIGGLNLPAGAQPHELFSFQLALVNGAGQTVYTQPRSFRLNFTGGAVANGPPIGQQPPIGQAPSGPGSGVGIGKYSADVTIQIKITGVSDANSRQFILNRLPVLMGGGSHLVRSSSTANGMLVTLAPVKDAQAFAAKIDFGKVTGVQGRTITVAAK